MAAAVGGNEDSQDYTLIGCEQDKHGGQTGLPPNHHLSSRLYGRDCMHSLTPCVRLCIEAPGDGGVGVSVCVSVHVCQVVGGWGYIE